MARTTRETTDEAYASGKHEAYGEMLRQFTAFCLTERRRLRREIHGYSQTEKSA